MLLFFIRPGFSKENKMLLLQLIWLLRPDSHRHRRPYVNIRDRRERTPKDNADTVAEDRIRDDIAELIRISMQRITTAQLHGRSCVRCFCVRNAQQRMQDLLPTLLPGSSVLFPGAPANKWSAVTPPPRRSVAHVVRK
jgi:hypothetical protein